MQKLNDISQRFFGVPKRLLEKYHAQLFWVVILALGLVARWFFVPFESGDMTEHLLKWWYKIKEMGGLPALANLPGDYTPPYPTLMALLSYTPLPPLLAIKLINAVGDILLTVAVYLLLHQLGASPVRCRIGSAMAFMLPTVILNSSVWGQCDAIFTALLLLFLYNYLQDKPGVAMLFFGAAVAFKLQAIFLAPLVVVLVVVGRLRLRHALLSMVSYMALFLPSIVMGAPVSILWDVYLFQGKNYDGHLTMNAPNAYAWLNVIDSELNTMLSGGFVFCGLCVVGIFCYWLWLHRAQFNKRLIFIAAVFVAELVPFVMPRMHERYFFVAEILVLIYALLYIFRWYLVAITQVISVMSYSVFFFAVGWPWHPAILSFGHIVVLAVLGMALYKGFEGKNNPQKE